MNRTIETYNIKVLMAIDTEGLARYPDLSADIKNISDYDTFMDILSCMNHYVSRNSRASELVVTRCIHFYCVSCEAYIGNKTFPFEEALSNYFRYDGVRRVESEFVESDTFTCDACGQTSSFTIRPTSSM